MPRGLPRGASRLFRFYAVNALQVKERRVLFQVLGVQAICQSRMAGFTTLEGKNVVGTNVIASYIYADDDTEDTPKITIRLYFEVKIMRIRQFNPLKILSHRENVEKIIAGENPPPITCEIDPSNLCNHQCIWCMYEDFKREKPQLIPKETLLRLVKELGGGGVKSLIFTGGGEPLTHPDCLLAMSLAKDIGMKVGLVTNGGLLNKEIDESIVDICAFIRISLDAATKKKHAELHKPNEAAIDNFQNIVSNIKYIAELKRRASKVTPTVGMAYLAHPKNYMEIYDAAVLAKEVGCDYIQIRPAYLPGQTVSPHIRKETQDLMIKALHLDDERFNVIPILHRFDEMSGLERGYSACLANALVGIIAADCEVYCCCQLKGNPAFSMGSIKNMSFWDVWNGSKRKEVIRRIDLAKCPPCRLNRYNEIMNYLADKDKLHTDFL
ncbi:MAG: radical SAM protein [Lentisphaerae bacterium]|nr:radical SAM protein [Lentisphaerota bacterium]